MKLLFQIILIFFVSSYAHSQSLTDGLVAHFSLDGNTNDLSILGIDGVGTNITPSQGITNVSNTAYSFNGINSTINCGVANRNILDTVTISVWVKSTSSAYGWITGKYDWMIDKGYFVSINSGKLLFGSRNNGNAYHAITSPNNINDGNWHHVVASVLRNEMKLWIDCNLVGTFNSNTTTPNLTNNEPLTIGNYNMGDSGTGSEHFFDGTVDDIRIYNRALTSNEIQVLCSNSLSISENQAFSKDLTLFPNPAIESFTIRQVTFENANYTIHDNQGRLIQSGNLKMGDNVLFLPNEIESGLYIVSVEKDNVKAKKQIVVLK